MDDAALDALITETHAEIVANETQEQEVIQQPKEPEAPAEPEAPKEGEEKPDEPFEGSKKEANALERKRKQLEQARRVTEAKDAENKQLKERLEKLEKLVNPERAANGAPMTLPSGEPNPDAYTDYQKYLDDRQDYRLDQREKAKNAELAAAQPAPIQEDTEYQALMEERTAPFKSEIQKDQEAVALLQKYEAVEIPNEIADIFLEMEPQDAIRTFKALAKDGFLADLASMPLAKAALEIGKASLASTPKQTNAPKPLPASRGSVVAEKSFMDMDENASRAWLKT